MMKALMMMKTSMSVSEEDRLNDGFGKKTCIGINLLPERDLINV